LKLAHAIQLVVLRPPQTVLLTKGHRSKPQNTRLIPKFSEAVGNRTHIKSISENTNNSRARAIRKWCELRPQNVAPLRPV